MFVDASAIVAILTDEPEADGLTNDLAEARSPITSPRGDFVHAARQPARGIRPSDRAIERGLEYTASSVVPLRIRQIRCGLT